MKKIILVAVAMVCAVICSSQADDDFMRKGRWVLETGTGSILSFNASSGGSILFDDGSTLIQLGIDAGKFITEDLALKFRLGFLDIGGSSLVNIGTGAKYYLGGVAPIEIDLGVLTGGGNSQFIGGAHIGYAAALAPNIYFEPKVGLFYSDGGSVGSIKLGFMMIL